MNLLTEESRMKGKLETLEKVIKKDLYRMDKEERDFLMTTLMSKLKGIHSLEEFEKVEDRYFACENIYEIKLLTNEL